MASKKVSNEVKVLEQKLENANNSEERQKIIAREIFLTKSGPLPDPKDFSKYEEVLPGSANRIIEMAEKNQQHRIRIELTEQELYYKSNNTITSKGIYSSTIISIVGIVGAVILGVFGSELASGIIGSLSLGNIVVSMINSTINSIRRKE
ncbi:DUF2335 domain-containing protein [Staphylococcus muscae]|uniref:Predicted membrane protein n=1 Tax=Staphylococcus muscae TaxID=1294 RepID=A0A240BYZ7_9STAP|nr:DUF2335 domain-containing protein [Staphylococcus muscae]AVQ34452.1 DUF2335 domain-containing protein [Staphylococcus muscae]PNZ01659.1 DUF2335 domain-containing protein [Staphylococcus muscae]GGA92947.1 hypothetical protein GCM10007183_16390 [Staphylococcus muscae]SNW00885.1 Predicted membrane protein [Staphylococcus muscae]